MMRGDDVGKNIAFTECAVKKKPMTEIRGAMSAAATEASTSDVSTQFALDSNPFPRIAVRLEHNP
jgi:hypothetical protein